MAVHAVWLASLTGGYKACIACAKLAPSPVLAQAFESPELPGAAQLKSDCRTMLSVARRYISLHR